MRHSSNRSAIAARPFCSSGLVVVALGWILEFIGCVEPYPKQSIPEVKTHKAWSVNWSGVTNAPEGPWWERFKDPELNRLITGALASNANLAVLAERVGLARAEGRLDTAGSRPRVSAGTGLRAGRRRMRETDYKTESLKPMTASGAMAWEMDWLGKWRTRHTAAQERVRATAADLNAVLSLAENIAEIPGEPVVVIKRLLDILGSRDGRLDLLVQQEAQVVENHEIHGIHRHDQATVFSRDRNDIVLNRDLLRHQGDDLFLDLHGGEIGVGQTPMLGQRPADILLRAGFSLHERLTEPAVLILGVLERLFYLSVVDDPFCLEDLTDSLLVQG